MIRIPSGAIIVGVDGSASSDAATVWAADEATRRGKPLHLIHAREDDGWWLRAGTWPPDEVAYRPDSTLGSRVLLAQERHPELEVTCESAGIQAAAALVERSGLADLIVLGSRGHGVLRGALLGSISRQVAAHAACPVVVVPDESYQWRTEAGVIVGVDGSPGSKLALEFAFAYAADHQLGVTAVNAWWGAEKREADERRRTLQSALAPLQEKYPEVPVRQSVVDAQPVDALVAASAAGQMLVVGSRGAGGFRGLVLGSVSHRVLQRAHCPVAVIRPPRED